MVLNAVIITGGTPYQDKETKDLSYLLSDGYRMPKPPNCDEDM